MKTIAIIVAGGSGTRFGAEVPKQFLVLGGEPILMRTIEAFEEALRGVDHEIVVTLPVDQFALWNELCERYDFKLPHRVVAGGETRWHSVRPLASIDLIERVLDAARRDGAAIPVVMLNDSVRQVVGETSHALDRSSLRAVQTPQAFDARVLLDAYSQPFEPTFTDDASVVERNGHKVTLVEGDPKNLKITRPMDLTLAEYLLNQDA